MKEFLARLRAKPLVTAELVMASLFINVLALAGTIYVMQVLNRFVSYAVDATLVTLTVGAVLAVAFELSFRRVRFRLATALADEPNRVLAERVFKALTSVRMQAFLRLPTGIPQELARGMREVEAAFSPTNMLAIIDVPFVILFLLVLGFLSPTLALVTAGGTAVALGLSLASLLAMHKPAQRMVSMSSGSNALLMTAVNGPETVRAYNAVGHLWRQWRKTASALEGLRHQVLGSQDLVQSLNNTLGNVVSIAVVAVGAVLVVKGDLSIGAMIGANILCRKTIQPVIAVGRLAEALAKARQAMALLGEFGRLPREAMEGSALAAYKGGLGLKDLSFSWPGGSGPLFEHLDLALAPGQVLAVLGPNSSGKTTLARLLVGLLEPERGQILVDGVDLRQVVPEWWRRQVIYVPQEPFFLNGTLAENIRVANPGLTEEAMNRLVHLAGLRPFVESSAKGLDLPMSDNGRSLSLGIRKRVALARGLATGGRLMILDEPTEGLDSEGCAAVYQMMTEMSRQGRTIVALTHDPTIVRAAHLALDLGKKPTPLLAEQHPFHRPPVPVEPPEEPAVASTVAQESLESESTPGLPRSTHGFFLALAACCVGFTVWAHQGRLDVVSVAEGEVVPVSQVKSVQHLEGGIVRHILVHEGDMVTQGQPLVELDSVASDANVEELGVRLTALRIDMARLEAELAGKDALEIPEDLAKSHPDQARQAEALFLSRRSNLNAQIERQKETIIQRQEEVREIATRLKNDRSRLALMREQIRISEDLVKEELSSRYQHLDLLRQENLLRSGVEEGEAGLARAQAALKEAELEVGRMSHAYAEETSTQLVKARQEFDEFSQRILRLEDSQTRTTLRAPVDGVVKTLYVVTEGGVVRPGETVVDIVPGGDHLIVEAQLPTADIGFVRAGQRALVKLASTDASRFGDLKGTVEQVSPDAIVTPDGVPYYKVRIRTDDNAFVKGELRYQLYPGVRVSTSIITGQRTILQYVLDPFQSSLGEALRER